jgi:hypothetical protein
VAVRLRDTLTRVFGRQAGAGAAPHRSQTTIVFARHPQDGLLASAIACYLGASSTGVISAATVPDAPDDADFVVVLGERM